MKHNILGDCTRKQKHEGLLQTGSVGRGWSFLLQKGHNSMSKCCLTFVVKVLVHLVYCASQGAKF